MSNNPKEYKNFNRKYGLYKMTKDGIMVCVDGKSISIVDDIEPYKHSYILFPKSKNTDLIACWNKDMNEFKKFKKHLGFDFKLAGYSINNMSIKIYNQYKPNDITFTKTTPEEEEWIFKSNRGAVRYCKRGTYHNMIKLDINGFYSKFLCSQIYFVPTGTPEEKPINQQKIDGNMRFNFGLYHCKISIPTGVKKSIFFRICENNIYTHLDLAMAKKENYKITLLSNHYLYYKTKHKACKIFGKYIFRLYKHRYDNDLVKPVLNRLWGYLGRKNKVIMNTASMVDSDELLDFTPTKFDEKGMLLTYTKTSHTKLFKFNTCRITPFVTAYRRNFLYNYLKKFEDDIVYIHTDGWIMKNSEGITNNFDMGVEMGQVKIENEYEKLTIVNSNTLLAS